MKCSNCDKENIPDEANYCPNCGASLEKALQTEEKIIDYSPLIKRATRDFTGRKWMRDEVDNFLMADKPRNFLLLGEPGSGKTAFMADLVRQRGYYHHFIGKGSLAGLESSIDWRNPVRFAESISYQLLRDFGGWIMKWDDWGIQVNQSVRDLQGLLVGAKLGEFKAMPSRSDRPVLSIEQEVERFGPAASVVGVYIKKFSVDYEQVVRIMLTEPLTRIAQRWPQQKLVVLVDGLDEAEGYSNPNRNILRLLPDGNLPANVRFLFSSRDGEHLSHDFQSQAMIRWLSEDWQGNLDQHSIEDARGYIGKLANEPRVKGMLKKHILSKEEFKEKVATKSRGNFLYLYYYAQGLRSGEDALLDLAALPDDLNGIYADFLKKIKEGREKISWDKAYKPVLGALAVAREPLALSQVSSYADVSQTTTGSVLEKIKPFLDPGLIGAEQRYAIYHTSFGEYLVSKANPDFISAAEAHSRITKKYWPLSYNYVPSWSGWDDYGIRYMPFHLANASDDQNEKSRHRMTGRLVALMADQYYLQKYKVTVNDLGELERTLSRTLDLACCDPRVESLPLIIRAARGVYDFRSRLLQPRDVFRHAARGEYDTALGHLSLLPIQDRWRAAALLLIAWLAAEQNDPKSEELRLEVLKNHELVAPLDVLEKRLRAAQGGFKADLKALRDPPELATLNYILYRLVSEKIDTGMIQEYVDSRNVQVSEAIYEALGTDPGVRYLAEVDGPALVSYVNAHMNDSRGNRAFLRYLQTHAANLYIQYRNLNLWALMDSVLCHPDAAWTRLALTHLLSIALSTRAAGFNEGFPTVLLGLKAATGEKPAHKDLEQHLVSARKRAGQLSEEKGKGDMWGENRWRYCALAEAFSLAGKPELAETLLQEAVHLPRGFAGFMTRAYLQLVETMHALKIHPAARQELLDQALISAHRIQDPVFCALSTARVGAMQHWWPFPTGKNLADTIKRFTQNPQSPEFSPVYKVGEEYKHREFERAKMELPDEFLTASTLEQFARILGFSEKRLLDINTGKGWTLTKQLRPGKDEIFLPDPVFVPMMAARLASEVAARPFTPDQQRMLIQKLVALAVTDLSALDAVLSLLLLVSKTKKKSLHNTIDPSLLGGTLSGGVYDEMLASV